MAAPDIDRDEFKLDLPKLKGIPVTSERGHQRERASRVPWPSRGSQRYREAAGTHRVYLIMGCVYFLRGRNNSLRQGFLYPETLGVQSSLQ
jgi:hypothetical protein